MVAASDRPATNKQGAEALLDAAERLFLERGYANVSMQQIAEAVGFTKGATYYHFQGKEELFLAVSKRLAANLHDRLLAPFEEDVPFEEQLRRSAKAVMESFHGDMQRWWSDAAVVFSEETKATFIRDTFGVAEPSLVLVPIFRRAAEQGLIRNISPEAASRIYSGLVTAGMDKEHGRSAPGKIDPSHVDREIDEIVTLFLYGVQGIPPKDRS